MSTYSPSLRIQLITTGDQAGVWGTTTNTNLGTLVESAIAGYTSVSITSANQALTALNGAADESRNQTIALTTITGAAFAVYAPPAEKTYIIYNTSAYAATIYNSTVLGNTTAAGAGVVIPAGKTMTVWSDGTNFALQNTQFEGTTSTQTFGTNNTTLASTAFVQAALQALHPVGSIYMNATNANNPSTYLGFGTWAAFGAGRVPVGFDAGNALFNTAEETGGSYDATLVSHTHTGTTGTESANHTHSFSGTTSGVGDHQHFPSVNGNTNGYAFGGDTYNVTRGSQDGYYQNTPTTPAGAHSHTYSGNTGGISNNHQHDFTTASSGSSATNANIQPYITVYMWKRTA